MLTSKYDFENSFESMASDKPDLSQPQFVLSFLEMMNIPISSLNLPFLQQVFLQNL